MSVIRTYIATPKGVLIPGIHNIFYAGIRTLYAVPDDVLITGIHCTSLALLYYIYIYTYAYIRTLI